MLIQEIRKLLYQILKENKKLDMRNITDFSIDICPDDIEGDFSTNLAFVVAKLLNISPVKSGELITEAIKSSKCTKQIIDKVELAGKGFINVSVVKKKIYQEVSEICTRQEDYGKQNIGLNRKVQIEFVSANPTGPLHIGHGRGAAIGDSLARILRFVGYNVEKEYYVNDKGTQINLLGESVKARYKELKGETVEFPEQGYKGEYIRDIAREIFNKGIAEKDTQLFKEFAVKYILEKIKKDLENFDVRYDKWFYESSLYKNNEVNKVINRLKKRGYIYKKEEALWFKSTEFGDEKDRVVVRNDGQPTYLASDISYHYDKFSRNFDTVIDIWGADHHGYINRVKGSVEALGYSQDRLKIILYQLVSLSRAGKPQAMSTRAGEFVTLKEVADEVGKDACRFFFLMRGANSHLDFDLELAKKQSPDNPVYYVQYAHARICSIFREAAKSEDVSKFKNYRWNIGDLTNILKEPEELNIIIKLIHFPELIALSARRYDPHWVTVYLQELAKIFHNYYQKHRIISENRDLTLARLLLIKAIKTVLHRGLDLIGVDTPEKM